MKKRTKIKDIQQGNWIIDIIDQIHPDYKEYEAEAVETKTMIDDEVVTRYRILLHEKDGTTSFLGDSEGPFIYPTLTLASRDLVTFGKWKRGEL